MSIKESGEKAFENWYSRQFGSRWPLLKNALASPARQVSLSSGLLKPYYLDAGSVEAASVLPLHEASSILDMCAAPGGKTLYLATHMPLNAILTCNEYSRERKRRLQQVLQEHVPEQLLERITITGRDAARWSRYEQAAYDRILLDAPCSSERHVLSSPVHLAQWTPARIRNLAQRQWSLLSGAWLVLKPGGFLVYSTCALSREENDGVICRLCKKYPDAVVCNQVIEESSAEPTEYGNHVLPDTSEGAGPLFYALIKKNDA